MSSYIETMARTTHDGFARLFPGVRRVTFTDFPDHSNVGDTAIALGTLKFLELAGIEILGIYTIPTLPRKVLASTDTVYIHGGGNIAGLYPLCDGHRYLIAEHLRKGTPLIQGPQTVHFPRDADRDGFAARFGRREDVRIAARDERSKGLLDSIGIRADTMLMPDAVHMLGALDAVAPTFRTVVVARTDDESAGSSNGNTVDWLRDDRLAWFGCSLRWRSQPWPAVSGVLNPGRRRWLRISHRRLRRGITILSSGETIITDRLHAMLIGLQLGRSVIAVDNNNQKLTKYAETWFGATSPDVRFAKSFADARRLAR